MGTSHCAPTEWEGVALADVSTVWAAFPSSHHARRPELPLVESPAPLQAVAPVMAPITASLTAQSCGSARPVGAALSADHAHLPWGCPSGKVTSTFQMPGPPPTTTTTTVLVTFASQTPGSTFPSRVADPAQAP